MKTHVLEYDMILPLGIDEVFAFFADARNLEAITPPELCFSIITAAPSLVKAGTVIDYRLRLLGVPFTWRTLISAWEPPHRFVDEQLEGPYSFWVHEHGFSEVDGGTVISDRVRYRLPLWPAGEAVYPLVRAHLGRIFRYRQRAIGDALRSGGRAAA